jgi:hypothetical protein
VSDFSVVVINNAACMGISNIIITFIAIKTQQIKSSFTSLDSSWALAAQHSYDGGHHQSRDRQYLRLTRIHFCLNFILVENGT